MADCEYDADNQLEIGQPAPDFSLPNVDGSTVSLNDYRGKVKALAVIFWCNHCPYVIKAENRVIALANEYKAKDVEFVLISANDAGHYPQDNPARMKEKAELKNYPCPYLYNEDQQVALAYGAKTTPHVFLFDGDLIHRFRGAIDDNINNGGSVNVQYLRNAIEAILKGKAESIKPQKTQPVGCSVKWKQ